MVNRPTRLNTQEFIKRAISVHGDRYDYSKTEYINAKKNVNIICNIHGEFYQNPCNHINKKQGCLKCSHDTKRNNIDWFIRKSREKFQDKFDYSLVKYYSINHEITLICTTHGEISITPRNHLRCSEGCVKCGNARCSSNNWIFSEWEKSGKNSKHFQGYRLYIIKCFNKEEQFYKIGKTFTSISKRFCGQKHMPYLYEIKKEIFGSALEISKLEVYLKKKYKDKKYIPMINFKGQEECFNCDIEIDLNSLSLYHNQATETIARNKPKPSSK